MAIWAAAERFRWPPAVAEFARIWREAMAQKTGGPKSRWVGGWPGHSCGEDFAIRTGSVRKSARVAKPQEDSPRPGSSRGSATPTHFPAMRKKRQRPLRKSVAATRARIDGFSCVFHVEHAFLTPRMTVSIV